MPDDPPRKERATQLLDATERLLCNVGYAGLSAQSIATEAGVNKALVFYYFGGVTDLVEHVLRRYYARHKEALAPALAAEGDPPARVHGLIDAYLDYMEANWAYARIIQEQIAGGGPHLPLVSDHLSDLMQWSTEQLAPITGRRGPTAARHFYLSLSAIVVNYFTYATVIGKDAWGRDPTSRSALAERRAHVHWVADAWLEKLARDGA
jgi:AcrR family transcriptional regulator